MKIKKKIMVLGGGSSQIELIKECVKSGYYTILADIDENAPGRLFSSSFEKASTFDIDAVTEAAEKNNIDTVITAGTDQPVLTAASTAEKLNLPQFLDIKTALSVTNKRIMKSIFDKYNIPTLKHTVLKSIYRDSDLSHLKAPYVIKPFDSQGQRGVFKLDTSGEIRKKFNESVSFSREDSVLAEEYYDSDEITVSGWVNNRNVYIFTVTDRVTFNNYPTIGICSSHTFPSSYSDIYRNKIIETTVSITENFGIKNGPIYFQYLIGNEGLKVNEIACRLGGAYEDEFIPLLCGINLRRLLIKGSLGENILDSDFKNVKPFEINNYKKFASIPLLFCSEGEIKKLKKPDSNKIQSLLKFSYLHKTGTVIKNINNSTQRAGYALLLSDNYKSLNSDIEKLFSSSAVLNEKNDNMIIDKTIQTMYRIERRFS